MKKEDFNNRLAAIALIVIAISAFGIFLSLEKLGITGASSTGVGYTNVTVSQATDITVVRAQINFTDSNPGDSKTSLTATSVAAGACSADNECGINITNDGSVEVNITILDTKTLFDSATFSRAAHYLYNVTMGDADYTSEGNNCSVGYDQGLSTGAWRAMPTAAEVAICALNFTDGHDSAQVDINMTVPSDEPPGEKSSTITFTASGWA